MAKAVAIALLLLLPCSCAGVPRDDPAACEDAPGPRNLQDSSLLQVRARPSKAGEQELHGGQAWEPNLLEPVLDKPVPDEESELRDVLFCTADVRMCSPGIFVSRDPRNHCQFPPCPGKAATTATATTTSTSATSEPVTTEASTTTGAVVVPQAAVLQPGSILLLRAHTGKYLDVEGKSVHARSGTKVPATELVIERAGGGGPIASGDRIFLRAATGKYLEVQGDDWTFVRARFAEQGLWQGFTIEKKGGKGPIQYGDSIFLRAHTGKRVDVLCHNVMAHSADRGAWQTMTVEKSSG